ncbi:Serine-threonin protein phosphatase, putative [Bodo saltans]|uniref:Serine/threonine-protein phosphatase n=1 Tax=Bodo saltans TaxID=75058 RepID=A0A0S4KKU2_BODSA|nr:Serine-threonin protein phosphatase, putative [Bodo saltans]|eukprot:CUI15618.1 Serine-threonin protein phosphatase, putative [Bodo saltans]
MSVNLDAWEEKLRKFQPLELREMKLLLRLAMEILVEESTVQAVAAPVTMCGDIHGQFPDLLHLFEIAGEISPSSSMSYIFLGDLVDRGYNSVETLSFLLLMKVKYPDKVFLIRGNHETRTVTSIYGFYDECNKKYGTTEVWRQCCDVFDCFPVAALVDGKALCVHGGLSPELRTIDQIRLLHRRQEIPNEGPFSDLVWSDPENVNGWVVSQRGAGYLFGERVTREFMFINGLHLIARAHQLVQEGYRYHFDEEQLVTVWSAPNYCYRCNNLASVLRVYEDEAREFVLFREVDRQTVDDQQKPSYFL